MKCLIPIAIVLFCLFLPLGSSVQSWEVDEGWFGYPIPTMSKYGNTLCLVTSDNFTQGIHFKNPIETQSIYQIPRQQLQPASDDIQAWFYSDNQWILNKTRIGNKILSNIITNDDKIYMSVDTGNFSAIVEYDGIKWQYMNDTYNGDIHDLAVYNGRIYGLSSNNSQLIYYTGLDWKTPDWFTNISSRIENIAVYNGSMYLTTTNNQAMYVNYFKNMTKLDVPKYGIYPNPMSIYNGLMYCAYRNQIYYFNGEEFSLVKVISPKYKITCMYPYDDNLYIGTESTIGDNVTLILTYNGNSFHESLIESQSVYDFESYEGQLYAGTSMGLYLVRETSIEYQDNINCAIIGSALLGLFMLLMGFYPYNQNFEDMVFIALAMAFFSISISLLASPSLYITFAILIIPVLIFLIVLAGLSMYFDTGYELDFENKDYRILVIILVILFIVEIATGIFSKAILP